MTFLRNLWHSHFGRTCIICGVRPGRPHVPWCPIRSTGDIWG